MAATTKKAKKTARTMTRGKAKKAAPKRMKR
jgi:hypothetical protein